MNQKCIQNGHWVESTNVETSPAIILDQKFGKIEDKSGDIT